MPQYWGANPDQEIFILQQLERFKAESAASVARDWDQIRAMRAAHVARVAPWLQPGIVLAFGKAMDSLDPLQHVAALSAKFKAQDNPTNRLPGDPIIGAQLNPGDRDRIPDYKPGNHQPGPFHVGPSVNLEMGEMRARHNPFAQNTPQAILDAAAAGIIDPSSRVHMPKADDKEGMTTFRALADLYAQENPGKYLPVMVDKKTVGYYDPERPNEIAYGAPQSLDTAHRHPSIMSQIGAAILRPAAEASAGISGSLATVGDFLNKYRLPNLGGTTYEGQPQTVGELMAKPGEAVNSLLEQVRTPVLPGPIGQAQQANMATEGAPHNFRETLQQSGEAMNMPLQEFQGEIRNAYGAATGRDVDWWQPQSDFLIQQTTGLSPGKGYFVNPDSAVAKERRRRERERGLIDGHTFTLGRGIAHVAGAASMGLIEPDSVAYNVLSGLVDAGFAVYADPTAWGGSKLADIQEARIAFRPENAEKVGLVKGLWTNEIWKQGAAAFFDTPEGSAIANALAKETSKAKIWKNTNRVLNRQQLDAFANARTPEEVRAVLQPMLGVDFRTTRDIWTTQHVMNPGNLVPDSAKEMAKRALVDVPGQWINPNSDASIMGETEKWLVNSHVKPEMVDHFLNQMANTKSSEEVLGALDGMMRHSEGVLAEHGVPENIRNKLVNQWRADLRDAQKSTLEAALDHIQNLDEVKIGDDIFGTGSPLTWAEMQGSIISLPDYHAFKRLSSQFPNWGWDAEGQLEQPLKAIQSFQDTVWKPFQLLRLAWPVRVIGEEQVRMAAADYAAMFKDPTSFIAFILSRNTDAIGDPFQMAEEFKRSQIIRSGGWLNDMPNRARTGAKAVFERGDEGFSNAWAREIVALHNDELARQIAENGLADTQRWFSPGGEGSDLFLKMAQEHPSLNTETVANRYVESVAKRVQDKTNGDSGLLDAIVSGEHNGVPIWNRGKMSVTDEFLHALSQPAAVSESPLRVVGEVGRPVATKKDPFVSRMFSLLMAKPSNYLSRSPVFRQAYWKRYAELIRFADPAEKEALIQGARDAYQVDVGPIHLGASYIRKLERTDAVGRLTMAEVDHYAKAFGLQETQDLLYDLSRKSQIADSLRIVSPFAEAWKEVYSEWGRLLNPTTGRGIKNLRRFTQIYNAAMSPQLGGYLGAPRDLAGNQQGVFWRDQYGELNFVYPGSQWVTANINKLAAVGNPAYALDALDSPGIPVPLTGRVAGLSMFGTIVPGLGPVAAIPASWFLPDKPGVTRMLRDWILPYGSFTDQQGAFGAGQVLNFAPAWMRNGFQALAGKGFEQQTNRLYANNVMSAANYLASTGRYDTHSKAGLQKLANDAKRAARTLYMVKAFAGFGAPAAPRFDFLVNSNGGLVRFAALRDDYFRMISDPKIGPTHADEEFLKRWGDMTGFTMQAFTREIQGGVGVTQKFGDWARHQGKLKQNYPGTWAYFGPQDGKFDYNVYGAQIVKGERESLTLDEWMRLAENHLGQMQMDKAHLEVGPNPSDSDQAYLDELEDWVFRNYPGYKDFRNIEQRLDSKVAMRELQQAYKDPAVLKTQAGKGLQQYMQDYNTVLNDAQAAGFRTINGKAFASDRQWLFDTGQWLSRQYPDFKALWNRVLRNQVEPPAPEATQ